MKLSLDFIKLFWYFPEQLQMVTSETRYPANKEMFKVNCKNTIRIHEAYSKLTTKISEARHRAFFLYCYAFFIADFVNRFTIILYYLSSLLLKGQIPVQSQQHRLKNDIHTHYLNVVHVTKNKYFPHWRT